MLVYRPGGQVRTLQEVKSLYQASGIAHILAVSGLHVSVVGMFLYRLMRRWGIGFGLGGLISGSLVFLFAQLCGMGVSVLRAAGMFFLYLIAQYLGEAYDSLTALGTMAVLLLWANPFYLQNSGCIFSFGAVFGVSAWRCRYSRDTATGEKSVSRKNIGDITKRRCRSGYLTALSKIFSFFWHSAVYPSDDSALFYEIPIYQRFPEYLYPALYDAPSRSRAGGGACEFLLHGAGRDTAVSLSCDSLRL